MEQTEAGASSSLYADIPKHHLPGFASFCLQARGCAITIIVVHGIHLLVLGFLTPTAWIASLIAFIMAGIQLCMFQKCTYICAGVFYIVGFIVDVASVVY